MAAQPNKPKLTPDVARAFLAGARFTETGYGNDVVGAFRAYLNGVTPGEDEEFAADMKTLLATAKEQPMTERLKLTDNQAQVLRNSALRGGWIGGWVWGSQSGTEAIFRALTKKGLAFPNGSEAVTPCYYTLTEAGMDEAERIAEECHDDIERIRRLRAERAAKAKAGVAQPTPGSE